MKGTHAAERYRLPLLVGIMAGLFGGWMLTREVERSNRQASATPRTVTPRADLSSQEKTTIEIFEAAAPSVVFITSVGSVRETYGFNIYEIPKTGAGSGIIWDTDGHIVTNFHVISDAQRVRVTLADHSTLPATFVGAAPDKDLAVIKIDADRALLRPIAIGTSHDLRVGQSVFAIGNPFGLDQSLTTGVVSALGRGIRSVNDRTIEGVIQTDAAINPGNSGGPLLDSAGRLVGVNTQIVTRSGGSEGIGFAVPVDIVNEVVPQLIVHGRIIRPQLGVVIVSDDLARRYGFDGVLVQSVSPGSGAEEAGLRGFGRTPDGDIVVGDLIVKVNDRVTRNLDDLLTEIEKCKPDETVVVTFIRDGKANTASVRLRAPEDRK
ncbi:MAG: trypsin-like peptidase domain-containing protein [Phycisphaerae bacterium]|nr:trypsin-like peptidase domain-containing protein [Phycisphaerae bacterium]